MRLVLFSVLVLLSPPCGMHAGMISAASPSYADVSLAIAAANSGDTVTIPAGKTTWLGQLTITKGITLRGAGAGQTVISGSFGTSAFMVYYIPANPGLNEAFRLTGFTFDMMSNTLALMIENTDASHPIDKVRVDHNTWTNCILGGREWEGFEIHGSVRGVFDHNTLYGSPFFHNDGNQRADWDNTTWTYGSIGNCYIEDNTVWGNFGISAGEWGGHYVARYNTLHLSSTQLIPWFDAHGNQPSGVYGCMGTEIYGNLCYAPLVGANDLKFFHHRGGKAMCFYNLCMDKVGHAYIDVLEEYSDAISPTANPDPQHVNDAYYWNNRSSGSGGPLVDVQWSTLETSSNLIAPNVDFWYGSESFDGTSGVGWGPLAARPATCAKGVGYWATTQAYNLVPTESVGANPHMPISGSFYKATSNNTWTLYYTPLRYPHPMVFSQDGAPALNPVVLVTPSTGDYGLVQMGSTNDLTFRVQNAGGGTLAGFASVPAPFSIVGTSTYSLGNNGNQVITVRYSPTRSGQDRQVVTFTGGGGASSTVTGVSW